MSDEKQEVIWSPQPGPQTWALSIPSNVEEMLYGGARGGGKSDLLLGSWMGHAARHGDHARGILIRRTLTELDEIHTRAMELFPLIGATYKASNRCWEFPGGALLRLRYLEADEDASRYQGHAFTWIGVDEAGAFPTPKGLDMLRACLRSVHGVPCQMLLTANPGGPGHGWIKSRFIDPEKPLTPFQGPDGVMRVFIPAKLQDNALLMAKDPRYADRLKASGPAWLVRGWLEGCWDIVAGGMFDDVYKTDVHEIEHFDIPSSWTIDRSFDWGSSKPFSVGWWAESDGTEATLRDGTKKSWPRGTLFRIAEWYGWTGNPDEGCKMLAVEIARGILEKQKAVPWGGRVKPGPADSAIFSTENGMSIAVDMELVGVAWERCDKSPGSRVTGWEAMRKRFKACLTTPMEEPGLFVFNTCRNGFIRTVPVMPRDSDKPEDVDTKAEDHCADECRYRCLHTRHYTTSESFRL